MLFRSSICMIIGMVELSVALRAQPAGNIRGVVVDGASGQPLPFVSVIVLNYDPPTGTTTDLEGHFRLNGLPVGRYDVQCSFVGYEPSVFREIMVSSGREAVLEIAMRENVQSLGELIIRPRVNKEAPLNAMATALIGTLGVELSFRNGTIRVD